MGTPVRDVDKSAHECVGVEVADILKDTRVYAVAGECKNAGVDHDVPSSVCDWFNVLQLQLFVSHSDLLVRNILHSLSLEVLQITRCPWYYNSHFLVFL